jgi:uncharacterized protein (TIGR02265 family)
VPDEPVVFTSTVEGLIRALGPKLDERAHAQFAAIGIPLKGKLQAAYPRKAWLEAGILASQILFPTLGAVEQRIALGKRFVYGYSETVVGRALTSMMRLLGPRRSLARLERSFHTGNNYTRCVLRELEGGALELDLSDAPFPEYYQGMVEALLEITGAQEVEVTMLKRAGDETTYGIRFRAS